MIAVVAILLAFATGLVAGATYLAYLSKYIGAYDVFIMFVPAVFMFVCGVLLGRRGCGNVRAEYKPLFHGKLRQLLEGEQIITSSLRRFGFVKEKKGEGGGKT